MIDVRCDDCGAELSNCGQPDNDGIPEMDCFQCQQAVTIAELEVKIDMLRAEIKFLVGSRFKFSKEST